MHGGLYREYFTIFAAAAMELVADSVLGMLLAGSSSRERKEYRGETMYRDSHRSSEESISCFQIKFHSVESNGRQGSKYLSHRRSSKPKEKHLLESCLPPHLHMSLVVVSKHLANESQKKRHCCENDEPDMCQHIMRADARGGILVS